MALSTRPWGGNRSSARSCRFRTRAVQNPHRTQARGIIGPRGWWPQRPHRARSEVATSAEIVTLQFLVEGSEADAELRGGEAPITVHGRERAPDRLPFELCERSGGGAFEDSVG